MEEKCPFSVGDLVRFTPSNRTRGLYQDIERFGLKEGQVARIAEIHDGTYLFFDKEVGGFPWNEFTLVEKS
ncbi:MAG: hypothetical protein ACYCXJ_05275 [Thermoleophilia bacterium]